MCVYVCCVCMYMHMSVCDSNELFEHVEFAKLESSNSHITAQPEQTCEVVTLACNILQICHPLMIGSWALAVRVNQSVM